MRSLGRLLALGPAKAWVLLQALVLLPAMAFAVRRWGYNRVRGRLEAIPVPRRPSRGRHPAVVAGDVAAMVLLAARRGLWRANCLQRSLTIWLLLRRRGVDSELRFGVRPPEPGAAPKFHAWVEHDGRVIGDRPDIAEEYLPFGGPPPVAAAYQG